MILQKNQRTNIDNVGMFKLTKFGISTSTVAPMRIILPGQILVRQKPKTRLYKHR